MCVCVCVLARVRTRLLETAGNGSSKYNTWQPFSSVDTVVEVDFDGLPDVEAQLSDAYVPLEMLRFWC